LLGPAVAMLFLAVDFMLDDAKQRIFDF